MPEQNDVIAVLKSLSGLDISKSFDKQSGGANAIRTAAEEPGPIMHACRFLRDRCGVPHLRLVPYTATCLIALSWFFSTYPSPVPRNLVLLTRWFWRFPFLGNPGSVGTRRTLVQALRSADGEHAAVQALLEATKVKIPETWELQKFDARSGRSRVEAAYLCDLDPHVEESASSPLTALFDASGADVFVRVFPSANDHLAKSIANRVLWQGTPSGFRAQLAEQGAPFAASHGIPAEAAQAALEGDATRFLAARASHLSGSILEYLHAGAGVGLSDRAPLSSMLGG